MPSLTNGGQEGQEEIVDEAFLSIDKEEEGLLIWRIENFAPVPMPEDQFGSFFSGDSYLILSIQQASPTSRYLERHIHFWLGEESTQDEMATAAIKAVELDNFLDGTPIQHRETQGYESTRFRSYFKTICYKQGGFQSGFKHVEDEHVDRLYRVKGRFRCVLSQMKEISWSSFNEGDSFILDRKEALFVWCGRKSNRQERLKAMECARNLRDERKTTVTGSEAKAGRDRSRRSGRDVEIVVVESGDEDKALKGVEKKIFVGDQSGNGDEEEARDLLLLPRPKGEVKEAEEVEGDEEEENVAEQTLSLHKISDADGALAVTEVKSGRLTREDLDTDDVFIVNHGANGIYAWIGKKASQSERKAAMNNAVSFVERLSLPKSTPIERIVEGAESTNFKNLFFSWTADEDDAGDSFTYEKDYAILQKRESIFDAASLHARRPSLTQGQMKRKINDDGSGKKEIWRIENFQLASWPQEKYGQFFSGDCYIVKYVYRENWKDRIIIFFWLGKHSTTDERGSAALLAMKMDDELGGTPLQVRIVQGRESQHFMSLFGGYVIVFQGGVASGFTKVDDPDSKQDGAETIESTEEPELFHIRSQTVDHTTAIQVEPLAASLNSNDVFVLRLRDTVYVWGGDGASKQEERTAKSVIKAMMPKVSLVSFKEGEETEDFWEILGGKTEYANAPLLSQLEADHPVRLFHCSNASGKFKVEEVTSFAQDDLISDDVMILDAWEEIWMWIGSGANDVEKRRATRVAINYLKSDPSGRDVDTPILKINDGNEPQAFTGFFGAWEQKMPDIDDVIRDSKPISSENTNGYVDNGHVHNAPPKPERVKVENVRLTQVPKDPLENFYDESINKYKIEDLKLRKGEGLPDDVQCDCKEVYLSAEDFKQVFKMSVEDYKQLKKWRQVNIKKSVGLF